MATTTRGPTRRHIPPRSPLTTHSVWDDNYTDDEMGDEDLEGTHDMDGVMGREFGELRPSLPDKGGAAATAIAKTHNGVRLKKPTSVILDVKGFRFYSTETSTRPIFATSTTPTHNDHYIC